MDTDSTLIPLRQWIASEAVGILERQTARPTEACRRKKVALLEKTTVAYGIVELLRHAKSGRGAHHPAPLLTATAFPATHHGCLVDNFAVRVSGHVRALHDGGRPSWNKVRGVEMLSPPLSAHIAEPPFLSGLFDSGNNDDVNHGRFLEVAIVPSLMRFNHPAFSQSAASHNPAVDQHATSECSECRLFGILLYELYAGMSPFLPRLPDELTLGRQDARGAGACDTNNGEEPPLKKPAVRYDKKKGKPYSRRRRASCAPLRELGFPPSVSRLVQGLLDDPDAYATLAAARDDLQMALGDPVRFLFERSAAAAPGGRAALFFREGALYGREREKCLITDAFCRVSGGANEAFFVGGYSGSGKTALVRSLTARVDVAGGYVLTEKAEQMHQKRPLLGVLSAFDRLCALIQEKNSPEELRDIDHKLRHDFDSDFDVLARLLPTLITITSQQPIVTERDCGDQLSFYNICFLLQRFMRVVSSVQRPVVLFLDDCQWCSASALELIHTILSDVKGANCFFFVGSFRDNEVNQGHPVFCMLSNLQSSGVHATKLILNGLATEDINTMLADALCMFPRCCASLSEIVFRKTKGNPFFVREFLNHLVENRRLKYCRREKVWIWENDEIDAEEITDNVLYLLSRKMASFPEQLQLALKLLSCFGMKVEGVIVEQLCQISEYSNFREWLDQAISEGCIQKVGVSGFKFVHDKVQEAAYSFIPEQERSQFHYNLGMQLYSVSRGCQMESGALFSTTDQLNHGINHGVPNLIPKSMLNNVAELNVDSGLRAMKRSDYVTANTYFNNALALLPENRWIRNYELCLRLLNFRSKAAFSCGHIEMACDSLTEIFDQGNCLEDKLDAYQFYVTVLTSQRKIEAWTTCCEVLSNLNETILKSFDVQAMGTMVKQTGEMLSRISDEDFLGMKEMGSTVRNVLKFYQLLSFIAFWEKPGMTAFISCRMIQLTLDHGLCEDAIFGLAQYAGDICHQSKDFRSIQEACRIGKVSTRLLKRFGSSVDSTPQVCLTYCGFVAPFSEPLQQCIESLRKSFKVGMSSGEISIALYISSILVKLAIDSGENLHELLKEIKYYEEVMHQLQNKLLLPTLLHYRDTVLTLIDKRHAVSQSNTTELCEGDSSCDLESQRRDEGTFKNRAMQAFWCGYAQRCHHYSNKLIEMQSANQHNKLMMSFYSALNSFRGVRNDNGNGSHFRKVRDTFKHAMAVLKPAAALCAWNFENKVHLLDAEMFSFEKKNDQARASYAAAITSSCASGFLHEQGLACELAGLHYMKAGEAKTALYLFNKAKDCYQRWGSQTKVESITQHINGVSVLT